MKNHPFASYRSLASLVVASLCLSPITRAQTGLWRYEGQPEDPLPARAVYRAIALTDEPPADVQLRPKFRGASKLYAQLRYGSENSTRVVIVIDDLGGGRFDLYVDADRDRTIQDAERLEGNSRTRIASLEVEIDRERGVLREARHVSFRRGITGRTLSVATLGHVAGEVDFDGSTPIVVRRVDGNGNGLFSDSADRIWLDVDRSGTWDAFREQFPHTPVLNHQGVRYAVRADRLGRRLAIQRIEGVGRVMVDLPTAEIQRRIVTLSGMLVGDDGSAFAFQRGQSVVVPIGKYTVGSVSISLTDDNSTLPWNFVFSGFSQPANLRQVDRAEEIVIDPVGQLRFKLELDEESIACRPGETIAVRPRLYTQGGLLINASSRGETDRRSGGNHNQASIQLRSLDGALLESTSSGFA
jgi:hypothetical protein